MNTDVSMVVLCISSKYPERSSFLAQLDELFIYYIINECNFGFNFFHKRFKLFKNMENQVCYLNYLKNLTNVWPKKKTS